MKHETASLICNAGIVILVGIACIMAFRKAEQKRIVFRFFTALSNLFCAAASLVMVICILAGNVPRGIILWKYVGTCAVTVTFLTVMLFLGPVSKDYKGLLSGHDFFLHLVCPLLAIISYCFFEKTAVGFYTVIYGVIPVVLYAALYLYKVVLAPAEKRWDDFYGFNRNGKWQISVIAMICGAFVISVILWAV